MICDFCSAPNPAWRHPAFNFVAFEPSDETANVGAWSDGDWSACDACHELIGAGDRAGLAQRSFDELALAHPEIRPHAKTALLQVAELHRQFFEHRLCDPTPIEATQ